MSAPRVVFFSSDPIGLPTLEALIGLHAEGRADLRLVVTNPDRPRGRGQRVSANPLRGPAETAGVPCLTPPKLDESTWDTLHELRPDLFVVIAYGRILRQRFLDLPLIAPVNLHGSLLPWGRGACPLEAALAEGLTETGMSLMQMERSMDTGPVYARLPIPIAPDDRRDELRTRAGAVAAELLRTQWDALVDGSLQPVPQDHPQATYTRMLTKDDAGIDFRPAATAVWNRFRGLYGWPGSRFLWADQWIKVGAMEVATADGSEADPGTLVDDPTGAIRVACSEGSIRLTQLQRPGGRLISAADFLRGLPIPVGAQLESAEVEPLLRSGV